MRRKNAEKRGHFVPKALEGLGPAEPYRLPEGLFPPADFPHSHSGGLARFAAALDEMVVEADL